MAQPLDASVWRNLNQDVILEILSHACASWPESFLATSVILEPSARGDAYIEGMDTIRQQLPLRTLSWTIYRRLRLPPLIHLLCRHHDFFQTVIDFEQNFCRCAQSNPGSTRPHINFLNLIGLDVLWSGSSTPEVQAIARRATPYMLGFRALRIMTSGSSEGANLLRCAQWWTGDCQVEWLEIAHINVSPLTS